jgi:hypothetical protein
LTPTVHCVVTKNTVNLWQESILSECGRKSANLNYISPAHPPSFRPLCTHACDRSFWFHPPSLQLASPPSLPGHSLNFNSPRDPLLRGLPYHHPKYHPHHLFRPPFPAPAVTPILAMPAPPRSLRRCRHSPPSPTSNLGESLRSEGGVGWEGWGASE